MSCFHYGVVVYRCGTAVQRRCDTCGAWIVWGPATLTPLVEHELAVAERIARQCAELHDRKEQEIATDAIAAYYAEERP